MKVTDANVIRFHLQVLFGITVGSVDQRRERLSVSGAKVFGVPLDSVARTYAPEFGLVPCFLVDACSFLLERAGTVGLFRKPGSLPRIKALRAKLNRGDECFSTALPYDVATLVKQFCRELPEPLFPSELHEALLKAQALPEERDRTAALQLLSCLLPARNGSSLHYLFHFLYAVSQRCAENLMPSSNLAIVFAPCLLPPPNQAEMSEERLELRVLLLRTFIENPRLFGVIPKSVMDSVDFLMDANQSKKSGDRKRRSFKGSTSFLTRRVVRSVKTVPWLQGRSKVAAPERERSQGSREKPGLRRSLGLENFPSIQMFRTYMPCAGPGADSPDGSSPAARDACRTPPHRLRRDLFFPRWSRDAGGSPVLTAVGKLQLPAWRRRSSL